MKNAARCEKKLAALLKKLAPAPAVEVPDQDDPIAAIVLSVLMWETSTDKALAAYQRISERVVDFNELRVCMPYETVDIIGERYPMALERCQRLRAVLRNIYLREHAVNLDALRNIGKREVKKYLESLEGMVPYVSARVMLLCFDAHAMPVDEQLRSRLIAEGAAGDEADVAELSNWLARQVKASDGVATHFALQAWIDEVGRASGRRPRKTKKTAGAKKSTSRRKTSSTKTGTTNSRKARTAGAEPG